MFKSQFSLMASDSMFVWFGRIIFFLMMVSLIAISFGYEVHSSFLNTVWGFAMGFASVWILTGLFDANRILAARRVLRRLAHLSSRDDQLRCAIRQVLTDEIAAEILAVERLNPARAQELKVEFRRLHKDGQILGLISTDEKWDQYFKRAMGGSMEEDQNLPNEGGDEMALRV